MFIEPPLYCRYTLYRRVSLTAGFKGVEKLKKLKIFVLLAVAAMLTACGGGKKGLDMSEFPFYREDTGAITYEFGSEEMYRPYWRGNVMYNEEVLAVQDGEDLPKGRLLYKPLRIISVRDYTLGTEYREGVDFTVAGKDIVLTASSNAPYLTAANLLGQGLPEPYRQVNSIANVLTDYVMFPNDLVYTESPLFYGNALSVTYVFDMADTDLSVFKTHDVKLSAAEAKLKSGEAVNLTVIGDSISEGCSASKHFNRAPYQISYAEIVKEGLKDIYGAEVNLINKAVGGKTAEWGAEQTQIEAVIASNPDILIIGFGMNDGTGGVSVIRYQGYIELIVNRVKTARPDCSIILLHTFPPNPLHPSADLDKFRRYGEELSALADLNDGVAMVDMWKVGQAMLDAGKPYPAIAVNNVNHPGDFFHRVYAQNVLSAIAGNW